jgi:hypothetical protein
VYEWLDPLRESYNLAVGLATIRTTFIVNHEAMVLAVNIVFGEASKVSDSQFSAE